MSFYVITANQTVKKGTEKYFGVTKGRGKFSVSELHFFLHFFSMLYREFTPLFLAQLF
jgi:hypothetical protein